MTAALRLRVLPRFPARIEGADGVKVTRAAGSPDLTVSLDFANLGDIAGIPDPANNYFAMYDETTGTYVRIPFQSMFDAAGVSAGYPTKAAAQLAVIPAPTNAILLFGNAAVGDGEGGLYIDVNNGSSDTFVSAGGTSRTWYRATDVGTARLVDSSVTTAKLADGAATTDKIGDGAVVTAKLADEVLTPTKVKLGEDFGTALSFTVWPSGTLRTLQARARDTYCILDAPGNPDPTGVNDSTASFEAMVAEGVKCEVTNGDYILTRGLELPDGVVAEGQGRGYIFGGRTRLLLAGTGLKSHSIPGATPTVVANPGAGEAYLADSGTRGNNYSTVDWTQNFSAAFIFGKASGLKNISVIPFFNGVAGYSGTDGALSDEWDVGVWLRNSDQWVLEDCNVIGHWRKAACLVSTHDIGDGKVPSNEIGKAVRCTFQGKTGLSVRSPEVIVGENYGFAGTRFVDCLVRGLNHQSAHLATSDFLSTPFSTPSAALEISGDIMRAIKFAGTQFFNRDDIMMFFGKCSEINILDCYEEGKSIKVGGNWLANSEGSRMVATNDAVKINFGDDNSQYVVDFSSSVAGKGQTRDSSLAGKRYTALGVFNPNTHFDGDYIKRVFGTYIGDRMRTSSDRRIIEDENGVAQIVFDARGRVQSQLLFSGTVTVADDAAASIPAPKNGGRCIITCCGTAENGNFPDPLRSGQVFYDVGTAAFSATKEYGGTNFVAVNTDVTGTTGVDGNVTVGVIAGNVRLENRAGASQVFRYVFLA
ncbi:hypothetical protein U8C35_07830 [Sinorhizobium medicae]|uniref:hypothetical protein n=1 Tax=Sinorhizobium medicae TaxID=110321 RepID=UPI002AF6BFCC|nr:hypothetical protein [Sinorhizobium medicae]WQO60321.1 hypothetical protein U8C35_07830 [Sinorhizobium medicae]